MKAILAKNNHLTTIILLFLTWSLTSCFDVIQDVKVNSDRSGEFKLKVNLSKSKDQLDRLLSQDSIQGHKIPSKSEISSKLNQLKSKLSQLEGISNVVLTKNFSEYIFDVSFSFKNIDNLNQAQNEIKQLDPNIGQPVRFTLTDKMFSCQYSEKLLAKANNKLVKFKFEELKTANLISIFRFDKNVKNCSSSSCKISKNGQNTFNKISATDFIENTRNQSISVSFK